MWPFGNWIRLFAVTEHVCAVGKLFWCELVYRFVVCHCRTRGWETLCVCVCVCSMILWFIIMNHSHIDLWGSLNTWACPRWNIPLYLNYSSVSLTEKHVRWGTRVRLNLRLVAASCPICLCQITRGVLVTQITHAYHVKLHNSNEQQCNCLVT